MPIYTYKARGPRGRLVKGTMETDNKEEVVNRLQKMGYMTTQVAELSVHSLKIESILDRLKTISTEDMILFNVQLSNMINSGINILNALDTLSKQTENKRLKEAAGNIRRSIEAGDSLSQALVAYPYIFSKLFVNMVRAGEASGKLDTVLSRYADYFEHQADLRQKIKMALFYPTVLLVVGIAVTLFIVTFIIPQFVELFVKSGLKLPMPTLILYKVGMSIKHFWHLFILFGVLAYLGIRYFIRTERGRLILDRLKLKLPIIGPLHRKAAISRFARTLGTLVASGVPLLQSLDIVREVVNNEILSGVISSLRSSVEKGERIADSLKVSGEFPPDVTQMISVGEEAGNLDGMLNKISDFYDLSLGYTIKKLTAIIEPFFLVIMGSIVGFIMASMLLPIFDMVKILRH